MGVRLHTRWSCNTNFKCLKQILHNLLCWRQSRDETSFIKKCIPHQQTSQDPPPEHTSSSLTWSQTEKGQGQVDCLQKQLKNTFHPCFYYAQQWLHIPERLSLPAQGRCSTSQWVSLHCGRPQGWTSPVRWQHRPFRPQPTNTGSLLHQNPLQRKTAKQYGFALWCNQSENLSFESN